MQYKGLRGTKKIKDIFIDEKIPRKKRDEIIVVADDNDKIIWLIGIRKSEINTNFSDGRYVVLQYNANSEGEMDAQRY